MLHRGCPFRRSVDNVFTSPLSIAPPALSTAAPAPAVSTTAPAPQRSPRAVRVAALSLFFLTESIIFFWLLAKLAEADWISSLLTVQFVLAVAAGAAHVYGMHVRRRAYDLPLQAFAELLSQVRGGERPLADITATQGALRPLALAVHDILRESREGKVAIAELERDVRHRIHNRTEALERRIGSLQQQATRDPLTGLLNRRALDEHLLAVFHRAREARLPVGVLMIDVDNFKPLKDTLGHAAGDEFLRSLGQILRSTLRDGDVAFRCGGDEFVVVVEGSSEQAAAVLAQRLTSLVDGLSRALKVPAPPRLSIGAATTRDTARQSPQSLLEEADRRLYAIKSERKKNVLSLGA